MIWTHDRQKRRKEGVEKGKEQRHVPWLVATGYLEVTILLISTNSKLIWSMYIHQSTRAIASLIAQRYLDRPCSFYIGQGGLATSHLVYYWVIFFFISWGKTHFFCCFTIERKLETSKKWKKNIREKNFIFRWRNSIEAFRLVEQNFRYWLL